MTGYDLNYAKRELRYEENLKSQAVIESASHATRAGAYIGHYTVEAPLLLSLTYYDGWQKMRVMAKDAGCPT